MLSSINASDTLQFTQINNLAPINVSSQNYSFNDDDNTASEGELNANGDLNGNDESNLRHHQPITNDHCVEEECNALSKSNLIDFGSPLGLTQCAFDEVVEMENILKNATSGYLPLQISKNLSSKCQCDVLINKVATLESEMKETKKLLSQRTLMVNELQDQLLDAQKELHKILSQSQKNERYDDDLLSLRQHVMDLRKSLASKEKEIESLEKQISSKSSTDLQSQQSKSVNNSTSIQCIQGLEKNIAVLRRKIEANEKVILDKNVTIESLSKDNFELSRFLKNSFSKDGVLNLSSCVNGIPASVYLEKAKKDEQEATAMYEKYRNVLNNKGSGDDSHNHNLIDSSNISEAPRWGDSDPTAKTSPIPMQRSSLSINIKEEMFLKKLFVTLQKHLAQSRMGLSSFLQTIEDPQAGFARFETIKSTSPSLLVPFDLSMLLPGPVKLIKELGNTMVSTETGLMRFLSKLVCQEGVLDKEFFQSTSDSQALVFCFIVALQRSVAMRLVQLSKAEAVCAQVVDTAKRILKQYNEVMTENGTLTAQNDNLQEKLDKAVKLERTLKSQISTKEANEFRLKAIVQRQSSKINSSNLNELNPTTNEQMWMQHE